MPRSPKRRVTLSKRHRARERRPPGFATQAPLTTEEEKQLREAAEWNKQALKLLDAGKYAQALPLAERVRGVDRKVLGEQHPDYATSLHNLAGVYRGMGEHAKAEPLYLKALDIEKRVLGEEHPDYATSLHNLAELYRAMGEHGKAEPLLLKARDIYKKVLGEEHPHYATSLNNLGLVYEAMGDYAKAEPLYIKARDIYKKVLGEEHPHYATSLNNLGLVYEAMGDYAKAEPLYIEARDIRKKVLGEEHPDYAASLNSLAGLYRAMGEDARAEPLYIKARDIWKKVLGEEHPDYAASLNNLAGLYEEMGEYARAEPLLLKARDIWKKVLGEEHTDYVTSLNNLASLYQRMGEYARAEPLYIKARDIRKKVLGEEHPDYAASLHNLAGLYRAMGDYAKAEPLARESIIRETEFASGVLSFLPEARALALHNKLSGCGPLLSVLRRMPPPKGAEAYAAVWKTRAVVSRTVRERRKAIAQSPQAEELFGRLESTAQQLAQLTLSAVRPDQREARQKRLAELNDEKERLEPELARVSSQFRATREIAAAKPTELVRLLAKDAAVVEFIGVKVWSPPPGGRGKLVAEKHYDAFVLRPSADHEADNVAWVPLGAATPINGAIAQWRAEITGRPHPNPLPKGEGTKKLPLPPAGEGRGEGALQPDRFLREKVWDKIEPHLAGCSTVIIIPDGDLCFLPWPALPGRKPGTCLIEDYAIATAPSGHQLYAMLTEPPAADGNLLLAGGVAYDRVPVGTAVPASLTAAKEAAGKAGPTDLLVAERTRSPAMKTKATWVALPGTEKEIDEIRSLWAAKSAPLTLRGAAASEKVLREQLPGSRYVHLATHGFFADPAFRSMFGHDIQGEQLFGGPELVTAKRAGVTARNPLILSGIVLAGANLPPKTDSLGLPTGEDGILTAEEIVNLDLRGTELVVLSACDTGLGSVAGGEGVMGLTRAFHLAGARNVIASLWKVDDQATAAPDAAFLSQAVEREQAADRGAARGPTVSLPESRPDRPSGHCPGLRF